MTRNPEQSLTELLSQRSTEDLKNDYCEAYGRGEAEARRLITVELLRRMDRAEFVAFERIAIR